MDCGVDCIQVEIAEPVIRRIVRAKLRASLRSDDGREHNQDAIELLGDIRLKLIRKVGESTAGAVEDLASYAATIAYNACSDYFRAKYPKRSRLKNALRRLIEKTPQLSIRPDPQGGFVCGYAGWCQSEPAASGAAFDSVPPPAPRFDLDSPAALLRLVTRDNTCEQAVWILAVDTSEPKDSPVASMPVLIAGVDSPSNPHSKASDSYAGKKRTMAAARAMVFC